MVSFRTCFIFFYDVHVSVNWARNRWIMLSLFIYNRCLHNNWRFYNLRLWQFNQLSFDWCYFLYCWCLKQLLWRLKLLNYCRLTDECRLFFFFLFFLEPHLGHHLLILVLFRLLFLSWIRNLVEHFTFSKLLLLFLWVDINVGVEVHALVYWFFICNRLHLV